MEIWVSGAAKVRGKICFIISVVYRRKGFGVLAKGDRDSKTVELLNEEIRDRVEFVVCELTGHNTS